MKTTNHATITYSILKEPSTSGQGLYQGVASSYLSSLSKGDIVQVATRKSHTAFGLPSEPETIPIICVAAGTGIAPFRGFIQERAAMLASGRQLAPAILYFGCRSPSNDDLYRDEFDEWQREGAVEVRRSYSRDPEKSDGCRYAPDRMLQDAKLVAKLWQDGAKLYVCGSGGLAKSTKEAMMKIKLDMEKDDVGGTMSAEKVQAWFSSIQNIRYVADIFD